MIVAGIMSGTSADGINVALVRLTGSVPMKLIGHAEFVYPKNVRKAVLSAMNASSASVAGLARLNVLLGELYADAVLATQKQFGKKAALVGCHGQTLYHQGVAKLFLGRKIATTWQTGESAVLAQRLRAPVVSDFRPADMAAGGMGAPLVPFLDFKLFRHEKVGRIVQNIGGIANLTAIPAGASAKDVTAFDTGPGNMVMDALTQRLLGKPYDSNGSVAGSGMVLEKVLSKQLKARFFSAAPPKTAGREEFGREFVRAFHAACGRVGKQDILATATALTAQSIANSIQRFVLPKRAGRFRGNFKELIVSGGGLKNATLMAMLSNAVAPLGLAVRASDEFGLPSEAKEAAAFALLAYETWHHRPSNVPTATGANRPAVLGKISYA
jgi:anhydro-N-acetylmuramic acid kinase